MDAIEAFCAGGGGMLDLDTVASTGSFEAALHAAKIEAMATIDLLAQPELVSRARQEFDAHATGEIPVEPQEERP
jgi:hypothetical protein